MTVNEKELTMMTIEDEEMMRDCAGDEAVNYFVVRPISTAIAIQGNNGETLLAVNLDGTVTGEIENAGEAARIFMVEIRKIISGYSFTWQSTHAPEADQEAH